MFQPLHTLFSRETFAWQEGDLRHLIQDFLRRQVRSDALYCDQVKGGVATVRVASPALQQTATLLEFDLGKEMAEKANYTLTKLRVSISN